MKTCKTHGQLKPENIIQTKQAHKNKSTGEIKIYRSTSCRLCSQAQQRKSYYKHQEKRCALSRRLNKTPHAKEYRKNYTVRMRVEAKPEYIKKIIKGRYDIDYKTIPKDLIEAKQAILKLKRHRLKEENKHA